MLHTKPSPQLISTLAPTGRLRASINLGNPILASRSQDGHTTEGVSVDLAVALAEWLSLPLDLVVVESAGQSVVNVDQGVADFGFFAVDPARAATLLFTEPYLLIQGAYLVRDESPLKSAKDVDSKGTTVCVGKGSAYDLFLSRSLTQAQIVRADTSPAVVDTFLERGIDVAAGVRQQLEYDLGRLKLPLRLLPENFMTIGQAMATHKNRGTEVQQLMAAFIAEKKRNGFVRQALMAHRIDGAVVAPHVASSTTYSETP